MSVYLGVTWKWKQIQMVSKFVYCRLCCSTASFTGSNSPGNLGLVPDSGAYLTVQCTCPWRRKTSRFILVNIVIFTSVCDGWPLRKLLNSTMIRAFLGVVINRRGQFTGVTILGCGRCGFIPDGHLKKLEPI